MDKAVGAPLSVDSFATDGAPYQNHTNVHYGRAEQLGLRATAELLPRGAAAALWATANNRRSNTKRYTTATRRDQPDSQWLAASGLNYESPLGYYQSRDNSNAFVSTLESCSGARCLGNHANRSLYPSKRKEEGENFVQKFPKKTKTSEKRCWFPSGRCWDDESDAVALSSYYCQDVLTNTTSGNKAGLSPVPYAPNERDDETNDVGSLVNALVAMKRVGRTERPDTRDPLKKKSYLQRNNGNRHAIFEEVDDTGGERKKAVTWNLCTDGGEIETTKPPHFLAGSGRDSGSSEEFVLNYMRAKKLARSAAAALAIANSRRRTAASYSMAACNNQYSSTGWQATPGSISGSPRDCSYPSSDSRDNSPNTFTSAAPGLGNNAYRNNNVGQNYLPYAQNEGEGHRILNARSDRAEACGVEERARNNCLTRRA